jgi:hypothetical protein
MAQGFDWRKGEISSFIISGGHSSLQRQAGPPLWDMQSFDLGANYLFSAFV